MPGGQINDPSSGKHNSLPFLPATPSSPSRTLEGLFELTRCPSRTLDSPRALLLELQRNKDAIRCIALGSQVPGHCQNQLTPTLIVLLLNMHALRGCVHITYALWMGGWVAKCSTQPYRVGGWVQVLSTYYKLHTLSIGVRGVFLQGGGISQPSILLACFNSAGGGKCWAEKKPKGDVSLSFFWGKLCPNKSRT